MLPPIHEEIIQLMHSKNVLQKYGIIRSFINDDYNTLNLKPKIMGADVESIAVVHSILATNQIKVDSHTSETTSLARHSLRRLPGFGFLNKLLDICQVIPGNSTCIVGTANSK